MSWYLLILFATGVQVVPVDSRFACEALRSEIVRAYGAGSGLVDVRCVSVTEPRKK